MQKNLLTLGLTKGRPTSLLWEEPYEAWPGAAYLQRITVEGRACAGQSSTSDRLEWEVSFLLQKEVLHTKFHPLSDVLELFPDSEVS